ncbi:iron permease FTR1 family-domain-containing protein [Multifurca ochricompacta]|uniref:Iron permease FTR1 family-domain-containing protein n=1 Tax=Multifurca ochricompacta TaxID=376703 RepID=A0AAD4M7G4_9AGAM|nr:iron permease FTR1 family-domain-containing protein [Multifurca ochricompacta]
MARSVFSVPIFFIVFRETLEAAIIVSVLLGLVEQIAHVDSGHLDGQAAPPSQNDTSKTETVGTSSRELSENEGDPLARKGSSGECASRNIFAGSALGLFIAVAIGAAFIAVWFTKASDLWKKSEDLWEGTFELIASLLIFVMGITMLKLDRAKAKWRVKLQHAFEGQIGNVHPIAAITGIVCGLIIGFIIYAFASRATLSVFLVVMTNFILLIGAGLLARLLGGEIDDTGGDGPGSFNVRGNVWHLDCNGWLIFAAIFGWTNTATLGSVLSYVFYWIAAIVALVTLKWREGRVVVFGLESTTGKARRLRQGTDTSVIYEKGSPGRLSGQIPELPK